MNQIKVKQRLKETVDAFESSCAESECVAADDWFSAAGPVVDVFFPHTDTHSEDVTCSWLVIDQLSVLTHFVWEVGKK